MPAGIYLGANIREMCAKRITRTLIDLIALIVYTGVFNLCFYEQFYGAWFETHPRRLYYISSAVFSLFLLIDELFKYNDNTHYQLNLIGRCTVILNFTIFALMLYGLFTNEIFYLFLLDGSLFAVSAMILFSGLRHGFFKN